MSVLDLIELGMLRRADFMNIFGQLHIYSCGASAVFHTKREVGWVDTLLTSAFATQWNSKHLSYLSTWLFCNSIPQLCWREQIVFERFQATEKWRIKYILKKNTYPQTYILYRK